MLREIPLSALHRAKHLKPCWKIDTKAFKPTLPEGAIECGVMWNKLR